MTTALDALAEILGSKEEAEVIVEALLKRGFNIVKLPPTQGLTTAHHSDPDDLKRR